MSPRISVIMPTYNRSDTVERTILAYLDQEGVDGSFEVIVVDDGSTDGTAELLEHLKRDRQETLKVFHQLNKGPAAARNAGIHMSRGEYLLFAGDDVLPVPDLLDRHLRTHERNPEVTTAVLGCITWSPETKITAFMDWLERKGAQFNYSAITDADNVSAELFYSSNVSLHRSFLMDGDMFDERFTAACWEDIDLGMRLSARGMKMIYNKDAVGYHVHPTDYRRYAKRAEKAGYFEALYYAKQSKSARVQPRAILLVKLIVGTVLRLGTRGRLREEGYRLSLDWHSGVGIRKFLAGNKQS